MNPSDHSIPSSRPGNPELMNQSKAKPTTDINWDKVFAPPALAKPAAQAKQVYDTAKYLEQLREEDPWPEPALTEPDHGTLQILACRITTPAPVEIDRPIEVEVDITTPDLPTGTRALMEVRLYDLVREPVQDTCEDAAAVMIQRIDRAGSQTLKLKFRHRTLNHADYQERNLSMYLRAEAIYRAQPQLVVSSIVACLHRPAKASRVELRGTAFDAGRTFPNPKCMEALRAVVKAQREHPSGDLFVVGHLDGKEGTDTALAKQRSEMVVAYLTNHADVWLKQFSPETPADRRWGVREAQKLLRCLPSREAPHYQGGAHGILDDLTRKALQAFQATAGAPASGQLDSATRKHLIHAWFSQAGTTVPGPCQPRVLLAANSSSSPDAKNLPVSIEFLTWERPVADPSEGSTVDDTLRKAWEERIDKTQAFEIRDLSLQILDSRQQAVGLAKVQLDGPGKKEATADEHGWVEFSEVASGTYKLRAQHNGLQIPPKSFTFPTPGTRKNRVSNPSTPEAQS
jgi:outer membrane protein OmpA-like peptidoglycan-associated protein